MEIGAYVRINRNGEWLNLDITELTESELAAYFEKVGLVSTRAWAIRLVLWIKENVVNLPFATLPTEDEDELAPV